ncbi:DNRLRE domain-containing protein, partial [Thomasclavelia cocleata]|uniref:DNRLRE domain-containing protein n=1 Tax=Thomasclavelia cocleata TaxID=69824 RepID=UPI00272EC9F9
IILNEKSNINQIIYNIETSLTPFKTEHNLVIFQNENGENIFSFQNPYMYDNAEKSSMTFDTTVDIKKTENGYQLIYQLDTDWLNSEDRVYPIVIDPTVTNGRNQVNVLDTYVHPGDNVSHNHVNEDRLWIGNVYGTSRAFANWADLPTINGNINTAHISWNFFKGTSTWGPVSVYRVNSSWNSLNLTWDIHNTLSYTELASNIYPTLTNGYQGSSANVTNTIRGWYNGSVGKNGFMIRYTNESYNDYNTIVSSDSGSNSDFWPCLWINYNTDKPKAYTPTYYSDILDDIAISSSNTLNSWGYQTTFQRNPGQDDISNNITSQISILTGHGDTGHLFLGDRIISTGSSNEWVDGTQTPEHTTPKRRLKMGIKQWNLSTVDLMVFAACATAFENGAVTPLPKQAVESGVRTSVAWRQNIYSDSLQPFVNNLLVGLKNGKSVNDAVNYAKSFSYKDNRIYDVAIFGLANAKVSLPSSYTTKSMTIEKENDILKEYDVETLNSIEIGDIVDFIKSKINTSFDINDYIVERIDNIVRFVYAPSNIRTNNVYTAILNGNKVEKIYSHIEEDFESLDTIISAKQKLDVSIENQIKQDLLNDDTKQITIYQDGYKLENHELKYYVLYNINDNSLSYSDLYEQIIK